MKLAQLITMSLIFLLAPVSAGYAAVVYNVTKLPSGFSPSAINSSGQIVGYQSVIGGFHAALYSNGAVTDFGTLGGTFSHANAINSSGQIVGAADRADGVHHAFLYSNGTMSDLGVLPGGLPGVGAVSEAFGINDAGQVVGTSALPNVNSVPAFAFLYSGGTMGILGPGPPNVYVSGAFGINSSGQAAGGSSPTFNTGVAVLYAGGAVFSLGTLRPGGNSGADAINNSGEVVGSADVISGSGVYSHGFLYSNGLMTDLGSLDPFHTSFANAINNAGQIVGTSFTSAGAEHAFLSNGTTMTDLNSLIDPGSGWDLETASGINDAGQIIGHGLDPVDRSGGFLLTPVPEPGSMVLAALGFGGLIAWGWRPRRRD
jgi:probable HAF family extracellular repeat protein